MLKYLLILAFCAWQTTHGLYFHIAETERKCFIEEIPDETTVMSESICSSGSGEKLHLDPTDNPFPRF